MVTHPESLGLVALETSPGALTFLQKTLFRKID